MTNIFAKHDAVLLELLMVDVTTLAEGRGTRYIAELYFKLLGADAMSADDVKKAIDPVSADPATASAVQSKTIKLGMSPDEVKQSLGNPDKNRGPWGKAGLRLQGHEGYVPGQQGCRCAVTAKRVKVSVSSSDRLPNNIPGALVFPQRNELRVPEVIGSGPIQLRV